MSSFLIRNRYRLNSYKRILNSGSLGFFLLNNNFNVELGQLSKLTNSLLFNLIRKNNFNFFKGLNYYYYFGNVNSFLIELSKLYLDNNNLLILLKINNYLIMPNFFKINFSKIFINFDTIYIFIVSIYLRFVLKLFLRLLLFPIFNIHNLIKNN